jgi:hypothetical protein
MTDVNGTVQCGHCETFLIDETPYDKERSPCPICGSMLRRIQMDIHQEIRLYEQIRARHKEQGTKGYVLDEVSGDDYTHATGSFSKKVRIIDRKNDRYFEKVANSESGEIIHLRDEKLSEHFGRGAAKFQPHSFPEQHVAVAAYFIWEKDGKPDGKDKKHWEMAIEDLRRSAAGVKTLYS